MNISNVKKIAAPLIEKSEGRELTAYKCPAGIWTIGVGSTKNVHEGMVISDFEADMRLKSDMNDCIQVINKSVKVPLNDNQAAALVSFIFNIGGDKFNSSTLLKKLNKGDYDAVPSELVRWNKAGKKVLKGLVARRAAEAALWSQDDMDRDDTATNEPVKRDVPTIVNPENIAAATTVTSAVASSNMDGSSPITWAIAILMVAAGAVFLYMFLKRRGA